MSSSRPDSEFDPDRVVFRDKRRLDPDTGAVREPAATPSGGVAGADTVPPQPVGSPPDGSGGSGNRPSHSIDDAGTDAATVEGADRTVDALAAELTADLQRVSAEYANYRKRVDRDRIAVVEMATAGVLAELLPVLDDVERARQHGDLTGALKGVGEGLEALTAKLGLERFGEPGEPFDPAVHEALMQADPDPDATVAVCAQVLQPGYRLRGGRVLRPARVSVAEPGASAPSSAEPTSDSS